MKERTEKVRYEIAKGSISTAFEILNEIAKSKENRNAVIILQNQYQQLKSNERLGLLSFQEASLKRNQILSSILSLLDDIELKEELRPAKKDVIQNKKVKFCITIEAEFNENNQVEVDKIIRRLIAFTNDSTISNYRIEEGSIKIYIEADEKTYLQLATLFKDGNLANIIGHKIKELDLDIKIEQESEPKYDIGLSFAGENREFVEQVAMHLKEMGIKVFYDNFETIDLWGKDLYQYLSDVYKNKCKYTIIFISQAYTEKSWTKHELKSAQARAFKENKEYILPIRFDDSELPGLNETIGYLDARVITPKEIAELAYNKIRN